MQLRSEPPTASNRPDPRAAARGVQILAKSIYRELVSQGYDEQQVVRLATELIGMVTDSYSDDSPSQA